MRIREAHAFCRQSIKSRGGYLAAVSPKGLDVSIAQVIRKDEDDIGFALRRRRGLNICNEDQEPSNQKCADGFCGFRHSRRLTDFLNVQGTSEICFPELS